MTVAQVVAASKTQAVQASQAESAKRGDGVELTAPYDAGDFKFKAFFGFDPADKLVAVRLELIGGDPHEVVGALNRKYGKTVNQSRSPIMNAWMWRSEGDQIEAIMIGEMLTLSYGPQHSTKENGL